MIFDNEKYMRNCGQCGIWTCISKCGQCGQCGLVYLSVDSVKLVYLSVDSVNYGLVYLSIDSVEYGLVYLISVDSVDLYT